MDTLLFYWFSPFLFLVLSLFLSIRLKFFSPVEISGRAFYFIGSTLLLIAISWNSIIHLSDYDKWFIPQAYSIIDTIHFALFLVGAVFTVIGLVLFADYWQTKRNQLHTQEQKLSLLLELQRDAREPYHLMELFNLSLKEIVANVDQTAGALFLVNRNRRQLVLASSVGLSKKDTAKLEQYPLGQNIITQAIELSDPMISGLFQFKNQNQESIELPYNSTLVIPMISGTEKIGAIVLMSEQKQHFSNSEVKFLFPIAEWLAEKVKTTKLTRELSHLEKEKDALTTAHSELNKRLFISSAALHSSDVIESYCRSIVGIADSKEVHLFGLRNGALYFHGGSEQIADLSENYKTALIEALDKKKPIIINQESNREDGRSYIAKSSLIFPIVSANSSDGLLFVKESKAFTVDDNDLKTIEIFANLARLSLQRQEVLQLDVSRRKGLDKIISLLRFENSITFENEPNYFVEHLAGSLPKKSLAITFQKQTNGVFTSQDGYNISQETVRKFEILPGEGVLGNMNATLNSVFVHGKNNIHDALKVFDEHNRSLFFELFGEQGIPPFIAVCPIYNLHGLVGAAFFAMFSVSEEEKGEWQKLLTLASGLYSIRLTINQLKVKKSEVIVHDSDISLQMGETVNRLNNHLSAIIGNAELIATREDLSGDIKNYFQAIVNESEQAAQFIRDSIGRISPVNEQSKLPTAKTQMQSLLQKYFISDNMYQLGGSPKELNISLKSDDYIELSNEKFQLLFETVINRFAVTVAGDDVISLASYSDSNYLFLDISSHHKNFPPIQNVSEIGDYKHPAQAIEHRPSERYLEYISGENCYYAYDKYSQIPSYLSFKFKISEPSGSSSKSVGDVSKKNLKILAIDDQTVILDLITAMCQTLDYDVDVAESGEKGLEMALNGSYQLILTDLAMPGISGLDVARRIRAKFANLPIILITGWEKNLSDEQLAAAGISQILYKPFRIEQLIDILHSYLKAGKF